MNDVKDILNKMKFVPEELQDAVLEKIKKSIEEEIVKSCNPIDLVTQRLKELNFGDKNSPKDSEQDRRIIRIITKCMPCDWFYMSPIYCESKIKETSKGSTITYYENKKLNQLLVEEIQDYDADSIVYILKDITDQCYHGNIDIKKDSVWIWKDGSNAELWINTTQSLASEMLGWFESCLYHGSDEDLECAYKLLNALEKSFPKKD